MMVLRSTRWAAAVLLLWVASAAAADKTASEWFNEGLGLLVDQQFAQAEAALKNACRAEPRSKEAWAALAKAFKGGGKADLAAAAQRLADAAPTERLGAPPPLTDEMKRVLGALDGQPAGGQPLPPLPKPVVRDAAGKPPKMVQVSKYGHAQYCDLLVAQEGSLHAVFNERPGIGKPFFLLYSTSTDGGATWSAPKTLSDDESDRNASYALIVQDGAGRVYAIWKYMAKNDVIDGPGGYATGQIVYRCLANGQWSPPVNVNHPSTPAFSWSPVIAADGSLHLVWSQTPADAMRLMNNWTFYQYANQVVEARLDGGSLGPQRAIVTPAPLMTPEQIAAADAAGQRVSNELRKPRREGLINLRAVMAADGAVGLLAEHPGITETAADLETGRWIVWWAGGQLTKLYEFAKYQHYPTHNAPPALMVDPRGQCHVIRSPEKGEVATIRDYPLLATGLGEPSTVFACDRGEGKILSWTPLFLPGGRMGVVAAVSQTGGAPPDVYDLYLTVSEGQGQWWAPIKLTDSKPNTPGQPLFATASVNTNGRLCGLLIAGDEAYKGPSILNVEHVYFVQY